MVRGDQVNLSDLSKISSTCFYESIEFSGSFPDNAEYKTDLNLLRPDSFTQVTQVNAQSVVSFAQDHQIRAFKLCQKDGKLTGMQLQLGVPVSATASSEESETAVDGASAAEEQVAFDQLFVLYGHGNSDKNEVSCEYMILAADEYIHTMKLDFSSEYGLESVFIQSNLSQELKAGTVEKSDENKVIQFNESYQLVGLKGLGSEVSLDSIGIIIFDTTCDVSDPTKTLGEASTEVTEVVVPPPPEPEVKEEESVTDKPVTDQENEDSGSIEPSVILAICAFIGLLIVLGIGIFCYYKYVKGGKRLERGKKVLTSAALDDDSSRQDLQLEKPKGSLSPQMKMRRAKTTMFRDLVPKSADADDLLFDMEKGKAKKVDDYGDLTSSIKSPTKPKGERIVDFPRQATIFRRRLTIERRESIREKSLNQSMNLTTDKDSTSLKEDSIFNQTQQPMKMIEEEQPAETERHNLDTESKPNMESKNSKQSAESEQPKHNISIDRECQTIESALQEMAAARY